MTTIRTSFDPSGVKASLAEFGTPTGDTADGDVNISGDFKINGTSISVGQFVRLTGGDMTGPLTITTTSSASLLVTSATFQDPSAEVLTVEMICRPQLTSNNSQDVLGFVPRHYWNTRGHNQTSQHSAAIYATATPFTTTPGGTISFLSAVLAAPGNQGVDTITNAIGFKVRAGINNAGGIITNYYGFYQEDTAGGVATNIYGAYFSGLVGIGTAVPTYNLDINPAGAGGISSTNWMRVGSGTGMLQVASTGASLFPGYNPGAGGLGVVDMVVGNNGAANATSATAAFLYISSCAGTPTGVPAKQAVGRIAMEYDTTANKIWFYNGSWRGVLVA